MMTREEAEALYEVYERVFATLTEAEAVLREMPEGDERKSYFRAHGDIIGEILWRLRLPLVQQYPDLDTEVYEGAPDTILDSEEQAVVDRLSAVQVQRIDEALLADCAPSWRKVARVVGTAMIQLSKELPGVPHGYYAQRVAVLVSKGLIESEGNLDYMRYSEVRLRPAGPDRFD